ncbi:hypothetical protein [Blastococcus mobilis]|uniref:Uncharacterized protein n=1 Tax=Blastococcus mobilis TaxID=1938746 RepID=A0A238UPV9_9ACTN|nr:hypothetical protein [Blastococcus mobilis]SNR24160.1 hypothetical protein SAMN06272737_101223 [Blastococcus mobilis]
MTRPVGGIVVSLLRTTESRNMRGRIGGVVVSSLTLTAVGFVAVTALVIALARTSTARWEREKRLARAPRRPATPPRTPLAGMAARLSGVMARRVVAVLRNPASLRAPLRGAAGALATAPKQVASHVPSAPRWWGNARSLVGERVRRATRATGRTASSPVGDDGAETPDPLAPERSPGARAVRRAGMATAAGPRFFRRIPRHPRRPALGFLHRHHRTGNERVLHGDSEEGPTPG